MKRHLTAIAVCLSFPGAFAGQTQAASKPAASRPARTQPGRTLKTWAVLASGQLRRSGFADQVMAALASDGDITLVSREHLDLVAKELRLAGLLDAGRSGARRKAGAMVRADALAILSLESAGDDKFVRLVVCETAAGARLQMECIPFDAARPAKAAKAVAEAVLRVRARFPHGVSKCCAVPPFVSRNLGHGYDHLQRGCAGVLANALSRQKGVAVIEIAEARQIAREIALTGGKDVRRLVPVFIEGEYEVIRSPARKDPAVRFAVKLTGNGSTAKLPEEAVRLPEMARYLTTKLPALILGAAVKTDKRLTSDQQAAALVARADVFARLGFWEHSTSLREAALLLKDEPATRQVLVEEYRRLVHRPFAANLVHLTPPYHEESVRRARLWTASLAHVEYLVRNRQVSLPVAVKLTQAVLSHPGPVAHTLPNTVLPGMEETKRRFLREVFPLARKLEHESARALDRDGEDSSWNTVLMGNTLSVYGGRCDLDRLRDAVLKQMPRDLHPPMGFTYFVLDLPFSHERDGGVPRKEAMAFVRSLAESDHPVCRLVGRCALLRRQWLRDRAGMDLNEFAKKTRALLEDCRELERHLRPDARKLTPNSKTLLYEQISGLHLAVTRATQATPHTSLAYAPPPHRPCPVTLEPVDLKVRRMDGQVVPLKGLRWRAPGGWNTVTRVVKCGKADVFYGYGAALVMKEKGLLEEIHVSPQMHVEDLKWDGRHLWLAIRGHGLRVIDLDGKVLGNIGRKEGLPECDRAIRVCPLRPGVAIAAGALGEHDRLWVAKVRINDEAPSVHVFHRATRVLTVGQNWWEVPPATDLAGKPSWMVKLEPQAGKPPIVLLGWGWQPKPLRIDTGSLAVSLFDRRLGRADHRLERAFTVRDGRLIEARQNNSSNILIDDGRRIFHVDNGRWGRVDPASGKVVPLGRLPAQRQLWFFGVSAHYGIVGWNGDGEVYRIVPVDKASTAATQPAAKPAGAGGQASSSSLTSPAALVD